MKSFAGTWLAAVLIIVTAINPASAQTVGISGGVDLISKSVLPNYRTSRNEFVTAPYVGLRHTRKICEAFDVSVGYDISRYRYIEPAYTVIWNGGCFGGPVTPYSSGKETIPEKIMHVSSQRIPVAFSWHLTLNESRSLSFAPQVGFAIAYTSFENRDIGFTEAVVFRMPYHSNRIDATAHAGFEIRYDVCNQLKIGLSNGVSFMKTPRGILYHTSFRNEIIDGFNTRLSVNWKLKRG